MYIYVYMYLLIYKCSYIGTPSNNIKYLQTPIDIKRAYAEDVVQVNSTGFGWRHVSCEERCMIYMYKYIYIYVYTYIHIYIYRYTLMYMYIYVYIYIMYIYIHISLCMYVYMHTVYD
jgi:hypothetical protein